VANRGNRCSIASKSLCFDNLANPLGPTPDRWIGIGAVRIG
jgi:hypothetical protein